jgi:hypothetical protein
MVRVFPEQTLYLYVQGIHLWNPKFNITAIQIQDKKCHSVRTNAGAEGTII